MAADDAAAPAALTTQDDDEDEADSGQRSLRSAAMLTAGVGAAHAVLVLIIFWCLFDAPSPSASDAEIQAYYASGDSRRVLLVGLYLLPFAGMAFIWFSVALRMWIEGSRASRRSVLQSNIQLVAGIVYVAVLFTAGASCAVLAATVETTDGPADPVTSREFTVFAGVLVIFALRVAAMFIFTTCAIGLRARILPRWFAYGGYLVGAALLLSPSFQPVLVIAFPVWLLLLSAILILRARKIDPALSARGSRATLAARTWEAAERTSQAQIAALTADLRARDEADAARAREIARRLRGETTGDDD